MDDKELEKIKDELLKKLESEFKESETIQWFIEVEILRLANKETDYEEIKKIARLTSKILKKKKK
ncbi:hypothetical protein C8N46_107230 [Kordia periserrulae]|uniref:Uncharacterized protein n=1 Tax=Kordia periserrulae TaxID=701523 RepID=A0A2T6BVY6_9FLAO|nr:hypothetical protein [Kordia periserrulae]PTX60223.1 hypothetical protein C8N46_107230 [Kordia periserrulae]